MIIRSGSIEYEDKSKHNSLLPNICCDFFNLAILGKL